jgi:hypothetical protein
MAFRQRHFDLVNLVAERFKKKILPDTLTIEDCNSIIQYHFTESCREMNRLQEQCVHETRKSSIRWPRNAETVK